VRPTPSSIWDYFVSSVTLMVIASVVAVSIAAWSSDRIKQATILIPYRVRKKLEVHRLLTAGWIHADSMHLVFNMLTLWFFADEVVHTLGTVTFVCFYVGAVLVAFIPTTIRHMKDPQYASLGASGAVAAVMFSAILLKPNVDLYVMFIPIPVPAPLYAVGYLAYSAYSSYKPRGGVNHDAHFAGAIFGSVATYVLEPKRVMRTLEELSKMVSHWMR
jgi:membrane associated rhomboid family serine protease